MKIEKTPDGYLLSKDVFERIELWRRFDGVESWACAAIDELTKEIEVLRAKIEAMECVEKQEPSREWWDSLIADISAIDCVYRGDPSYAHDAYWLRERVMQMFEQRRDALPCAKGE